MEEPIDTQNTTDRANQDMTTDCPSTDKLESTDQYSHCVSTNNRHQDRVANNHDKDKVKEMKHTEASTDNYNRLAWLTDSETNPRARSYQEIFTYDNHSQDSPADSKDLPAADVVARDLANSSAVMAGEPATSTPLPSNTRKLVITMTRTEPISGVQIPLSSVQFFCSDPTVFCSVHLLRSHSHLLTKRVVYISEAEH